MSQKTKKASVLVVTAIVLGLILTIALSTSLVSILERKASVSSNISNVAYQKADTGIEKTLQLIKNNTDGKLSTVDIDGTCDGIIKYPDYKIELKDEDNALVTGCDTEVADIMLVKSTGLTGTNQRSVEVAVADEGESIFKKWYTDGYNQDEVYHAETDGIVTAYGSIGFIQGITDSSSTPTTIVNESWATLFSNIVHTSLSFPVIKGDYWKVHYSSNPGGCAGNCTTTIRWLQVGE